MGREEAYTLSVPPPPMGQHGRRGYSGSGSDHYGGQRCCRFGSSHKCLSPPASSMPIHPDSPQKHVKTLTDAVRSTNRSAVTPSARRHSTGTIHPPTPALPMTALPLPEPLMAAPPAPEHSMMAPPMPPPWSVHLPSYPPRCDQQILF
jgi:hypothetical protein